MLLPTNLGKWLLETRPSDDELDAVRDDWDNNELKDALIQLTSEWDDLIESQSQQTANWLIWKVFRYPFFIHFEKLTHEQTLRLVAGCERITLSIPRLHEPEQPMENGFFMLWDLYPDGGQTAIDCLARLLDHPDFRVQYAALHGLGHRGDARIPVLEQYIKKHPEVANDQFIKQCLDGTVI